MRCHQQNNRALQKFLSELQEELKMRIKFHKNKITTEELSTMAVDFLRKTGRSPYPSSGKENVNTSNMNSASPQKDTEVEYLKKQMRIQQELTRRFIIQITKDRLTEGPSLLKMSSIREQSAKSQMLSPLMSRVNHSLKMPVSPFNPFGFQSINLPNKSLVESVDMDSNKQEDRSVLRSSMIQSKGEGERQKSKTFARLRKVEALFCAERKKPTSKSIKRKKSFAGADSWDFKTELQTNSNAISEQNQNLKAIQSNLVTHLSLLQRYKNVPSIEELVQKQEALKRKESELKQLSEKISRRELQVNKTHTEVLKKQKSIKML